MEGAHDALIAVSDSLKGDNHHWVHIIFIVLDRTIGSPFHDSNRITLSAVKLDGMIYIYYIYIYYILYMIEILCLSN